MAKRITTPISETKPTLQLSVGNSNATSASTLSNPIKDAENLLAQKEKDLEAQLFNTVAGSNVVDPNVRASADAQIEGKLISAITGGSAESEDQLENLIINAVISGFGG